MGFFSKTKINQSIENKKEDKEYTLLIVDDEAANLRSLKQILESEYNILTATDGQEALELIERHPYPEEIQLIISDQRMPNKTGVEFLKETIETIPETVRIILTGFTDIDAIISAINEGQVYKFLAKPIEPKDLKVTIQRALEAFELKRKNEGLIKELLDLNASLEEKVKVRTQKLEDAYQELEKLSITDELTNLHNRRHIMKKSDEEINRYQRYQRNFCVAMFDVDHFKQINDTYGHQKGDEVLQKIAACIQKTIRTTDYAGRYGGEEFLLIFPETSPEGALIICERLRYNIEQMVSENIELNITISGGIASYQPPEAGKDLLKRADEMLYKAKANGRNCIETYPSGG